MMQTVVYHNGRISAPDGSDTVFEAQPSAVTVGSYDGVHAGHRRIIGRMIDAAKREHLRSVVVTFEPHPRQVVDSGNALPVRLLTLLPEKQRLMASLGIDCLFVVRFDREFSLRSSEWFIRHVLEEIVGARTIVIGYDHGFGRDRNGSSETLRDFAGRDGFHVEVVDEVRLDDEHFSSTRIRKLLADGRVAEANRFLGSPYMISGRVVHGAALGRKLGFPTVNIQPANPDKLLPRRGVYVAETEINGARVRAMMNIGNRPTLNEVSQPVIEAHLLDYEGVLYGRELFFSVLSRVRDEKKFASPEELQIQLQKDKKMVELFQK
ncbi:bifunctional riboflavin kinase/FAD synthetase [Prosthecochloris sp. HL-130-GSB]|jgi:riboflavin kinase / FMN adenylyltransferase|uniref:bifunctional riboflavin kinase/FAD synthetase n=1 Tax=Prosthecochloris sp. HL-130-GSB TaxID=1974213 RepID=UPI003510EB25